MDRCKVPGRHQDVAHSGGSHHALPRDRDHRTFLQCSAACQNNEFTDHAGIRKVFQPPVLFPVITVQPEKGLNDNQKPQRDKPIPHTQCKYRIQFI